MRAIEAQIQMRMDEPRARRASAYNVGGCPRALWYGEHGWVPEPDNPQGYVRRFLGTQLEHMLADMLVAAGVADSPSMTGDAFPAPPPFPEGRNIYPDLVLTLTREDVNACIPYGTHKTYREAPWLGIYAQPEFLSELKGSVRLGDIVAPGEIKCLPEYSFSRALKGDLSSYIHQAEVYMRAMESTYAAIMAVHRDSSKIAICLVRSSDKTWKEIGEAISLALADNIPARPYESPQKWPCDYCGYRTVCWEEPLAASNG